MVRVKICGITNLEDALAAVNHGADALGFVFAPSPRRVTADQARGIVRRLPAFVQAVGVFVNAGLDEINETGKYCGLDLFQLSGEESEETVQILGRRAIKSIHVRSGRQPDPERFPAATLLLDTYDPHVKGGSGQSFDWSLASAVARKRPIILAGGLHPENVAQAVAIVQPYAVDVASGVEIEPGRKDHDKIARFIAKAKALEVGPR